MDLDTISFITTIMKKIALLGIAVGVVLAAGLIANIGLFSNNALAAQPSMEQRIKTIFWMITNPEFGLKEIKNEVRNIEGDVTDINTKLDGKPDIKHVTDSTSLDNVTNFNIRVSCDENFKVKSVYADVDDPDMDIDIRYALVFAVGDFDGLGSTDWHFEAISFDPGGFSNIEGQELLSRMQSRDAIGIPANGSLFITSIVQESSEGFNDVIGVAAVVETAQTAECNISIEIA